MARAKTVEGEEGKIQLEFATNTEGLQKYAGVIEMRDPATDEIKQYPYNGSYYVAPPSLTVAPLKMNVFYIGVDNPVSISAAGLSKDQISPTISFGKLTKNNDDTWFVRIDERPSDGAAFISATAEIDGIRLSLGRQDFRVKTVPLPLAKIAKMTDGTIDKNVLLAQNGIIPDMGDFEFELYFIITSYTFGTFQNGDWVPVRVTGGALNENVKKIIRSGKSKQQFMFQNIQAKGPDGKIRSLNPINLELK